MDERSGRLFADVAAEQPTAPGPRRRDRPGLPCVLDAGAMYRAVAARDTSLAGVFYLGVTTTGIFCRVGCPSRVPRREHCEFFSSVAGAVQAGYRACLRCTPTDPGPLAPAWAGRIIAMMDAEPSRVLSAGDIRRAGADVAAASRYFQARFGVTVQAMSRARRVGLAMRWLRDGGTVRGAMHAAGFESESGLRKAVHELFGVSLGAAADIPTDPILARWLETPLGPMLAGATAAGVCLLEFVDRRGLGTQLDTLRARLARPIVPGNAPALDTLARALATYFETAPDGRALAGARRDADPLRAVVIDAPGTPFQKAVWDELRRVPMGHTATYAELARRIGRPTAVRAVAKANGDNRIALIIPCHRIVGAGGALTGYAGGLWRKQWLLEWERG